MDETQPTGAAGAVTDSAQEVTPVAGAEEGSLLTRAATEGDGQGNDTPDAGKEGTTGKEQPKDKEGEEPKDDPAAQVPDKAEGYELTFAKDTQVDTALLDGFRKTALEIGLTRGQAQKLGSLYEAHMKKAASRVQEEQTKALLQARKTWEAEITSQPGFREDLGRIQTALRQFGDRELYELLDQTNLGSHPKMFAFMAKIGRALAEPGFHGGASGEAKSAAEVLYPNMNH
ncbi:MAG: hypothetical protein K2J64_04110 [Desulfovibrio sp.]|nr:hypothetical protein [Desulfovibrio sp.]